MAYHVHVKDHYSLTANNPCILAHLQFEPPHSKTNKMTCAISEDSDQPGRSASLHCLSEETLGP